MNSTDAAALADRAPAVGATCIRNGGPVSLCGHVPASSISGQHYQARLTSPAVAWHLERIPGGLCLECMRRA